MRANCFFKNMLPSFIQHSLSMDYIHNESMRAYLLITFYCFLLSLFLDITDMSDRNTAHNRICRNLSCHDQTCCNDSIVSDGYLSDK